VRLETARQAEAQLRRRLSRWDCPTPDQLGDYDRDLLPQAEANAIAAHIKECARCAQDVLELQRFLAQAPDEPAGAPVQKRRRAGLGELIARLLPQSLATGLRGEGRALLTAQAEGLTLVLEVQPAAEGQVSVLGQVAAEQPERWAGALVTARQSNVVTATAVVDDLGGFNIEGLAPGITELRVTPPDGRPVVLRDVELAA
jgi:anti-sigma factor RsiW